MIYVASSWRNQMQGQVVQTLRQASLTVYDFKEPTTCFRWTDVVGVEHYEPGQGITVHDYWKALIHPTAQRGFQQDMDHLKAASTVILVLPAGPSAHLELGYAAGAGKPNAIYFSQPMVRDLDLMHTMTDTLFSRLDLLTEWAIKQENKSSQSDEITKSLGHG